MAPSPPKKEEEAKQPGHNNGGKEEKEEEGGFLGKVKDFIHDVGDAVPFGKPTADVSDIHLGSMDLKHADIVVDVLVTNPNPIPIPLVDINYIIESGGHNIISGVVPDAGTIPARGSETIKVPLTLIYQDIKSSCSGIEPGTIIPYRVHADLLVDVPVIGRITIPVDKTGEISVPYTPQVDLQKIKLENLSVDETTAVLHLKIDNKNDFDLGVNSLEYEVWLADVRIGGAKQTESAAIPKAGSGVVKIPLTLRPKDFGAALVDLISGMGAGYSVKGCIDVDTPFGPMNLPFSKEGGSTQIKQAGDSP